MYTPLVTTIRERCRSCYTCVRECPAKAIRISAGQAEVLPLRCIGCGNCVKVCSQNAKQVRPSIQEVERLLATHLKVAAIVAPSFPAEFPDIDDRRLVGMLRALGFHVVGEVAFGADLVAREYRHLLADRDGPSWIATTCPAAVSYVERFMPELVDALAPIVSPMVAMARALRQLHGGALTVVFVGPCIAKKREAKSEDVADEVDAVLTFGELRELFAARGVTPEAVDPSDFDPPHAGLGALFPISRGMLQTARLAEDLVSGEVVAADGRASFLEALKEFQQGDLDARLIEVLCCNGCIMGAGMTTDAPLFRRRSRVSQYVRATLARRVPGAPHTALNDFVGLRLDRTFTADDTQSWAFDAAELDAVHAMMGSHTYSLRDLRPPEPTDEEVRAIMRRLGKATPEDELNCGACGYETCYEHAAAIHRGLAESEMCLPYTIDQLKKTVKELALSHQKLHDTQAALMQSEKLASMGQLAAGIAHEVNNPLGVVLMYAHLLMDQADQLGEKLEGSERLKDDLKMVAEQAERCRKIVGGLLNFARQNKVFLMPTDVRELVRRSLKSLPPPAGVEIALEHEGDPWAELDRDQMVQVLTNLFSNAYAAMEGGGTLTVSTNGGPEQVKFVVRDTGGGIPEEIVAKIWEPFFTTKPLGMGTGLGLAVTYGIVKMHRGDIRAQSNADPAAGPTGTTFTVTIPRRGAQE
jgi:signal transduction histidine kinase/iron only hydrogenase large subunit-like protein